MIKVQYDGTNANVIEEAVGEHNILGDYEPSLDLLLKYKGDNVRLNINDWIYQMEGNYIVIPHQFKMEVL